MAMVNSSGPNKPILLLFEVIKKGAGMKLDPLAGRF
jgi:hypothetical protein